MPTTRVIAWIRAVRSRGLPYNAVVADRWLAVVFTVLAFVPVMGSISAEFGDLPRRPGDAFAVVLVLAQTLPLAIRSRWPVPFLAISGTAFAVHEALAYPPHFGTITLWIALYSTGALQNRYRWATALGVCAAFAALTAVVTVLGSPDPVSVHAVFFLLFAATWALGAYVRKHRAEEAERRRLAAGAAAATERTLIARELHDVVTHHVTSMVVQADAVPFLAGSPDRVGTAATAIGGTGRRALSELRYLLGVLEATGESAESRTLVDGTLRDLVERTREGGQPVELIEDGDQPALPVATGLAVYRVVQEGLTNAVKYAAGRPTTVRISCSPAAVEVEVTNAAASVPVPAGVRRELSGGRGLNGLRERVEALGGELAAGERPDGGFGLRTVLPVGGGT